MSIKFDKLTSQIDKIKIFSLLLKIPKNSIGITYANHYLV